MTPLLRVLHLEDDPRDAELVRETLETDGIACRVTRVETEADFTAALERGGIDLILADYSLPSFDGLSALKIAQQKWAHVPFIFVSGVLGEEVAIEALKIGATDYVLKTLLSRLVPSVQRALREAQESTDRKRAEEELRRSEAYLAEAQRLTHTGSWAWTPVTSEIRYWSEECYRILGFDPHAGQPPFEAFFERIHPDDQAKTKEALEGVRRENAEFELDYRIVHPGGEIRDVHVVGHPFVGPSGDLVEFVGTVIDVTERKRAEEEQARLEQRLRQAEKMEAVGKLAGGVAHDFNSVLAGIFAYGEMLFDETPDNSRLKRYAQNVLAAANRGRALVQQILAYSRSQRGKRVPVDFAGVVAETLELVRGSLPANIPLDASPPELPLVVIGDATQLHQIVMNLCSNAIQAMSDGGALRVALQTVEVAAERALSHGALRPGRYVCLTVEDRGCGMDEATAARIFEPFFTTKESGRGTGLGLSIVYTIVAESGGAIDVNSAIKQGSTFAVYLPLAQIAAAVEVQAEGRRR